MDQAFEIDFPPEYGGQYEEECTCKGRLTGVVVRFGDGRRRKLTFVDVARLSQMLDDQRESGNCHYAEPGLVVVVQVTRTTLTSAIAALVDEGFFD